MPKKMTPKMATQITSTVSDGALLGASSSALWACAEHHTRNSVIPESNLRIYELHIGHRAFHRAELTAVNLQAESSPCRGRHSIGMMTESPYTILTPVFTSWSYHPPRAWSSRGQLEEKFRIYSKAVLLAAQVAEMIATVTRLKKTSSRRVHRNRWRH